MTFATKEEALQNARTARRESGDPHYVVATWRRSTFEAAWTVTDRMPMLGEWYDADGHRHG